MSEIWCAQQWPIQMLRNSLLASINHEAFRRTMANGPDSIVDTNWNILIHLQN